MPADGRMVLTGACRRKEGGRTMSWVIVAGQIAYAVMQRNIRSVQALLSLTGIEGELVWTSSFMSDQRQWY